MQPVGERNYGCWRGSIIERSHRVAELLCVSYMRSSLCVCVCVFQHGDTDKMRFIGHVWMVTHGTQFSVLLCHIIQSRRLDYMIYNK